MEKKMKKIVRISAKFINKETDVFTFEAIEGDTEIIIESKALEVFFDPKRKLLFNDGRYYIRDQVVSLKIMLDNIE